MVAHIQKYTEVCRNYLLVTSHARPLLWFHARSSNVVQHLLGSATAGDKLVAEFYFECEGTGCRHRGTPKPLPLSSSSPHLFIQLGLVLLVVVLFVFFLGTSMLTATGWRAKSHRKLITFCKVTSLALVHMHLVIWEKHATVGLSYPFPKHAFMSLVINSPSLARFFPIFQQPSL